MYLPPARPAPAPASLETLLPSAVWLLAASPSLWLPVSLALVAQYEYKSICLLLCVSLSLSVFLSLMSIICFCLEFSKAPTLLVRLARSLSVSVSAFFLFPSPGRSVSAAFLSIISLTSCFYSQAPWG